jgi:amino acid transporter
MDRAQSLIVVVLLAVFAVFICVTIVDLDFDLLAFSGYPPLSDVIASVALTFFAYLGFSVSRLPREIYATRRASCRRRCTSRWA